MKKFKAVASVLCAGAVAAGVFAFAGCKTETAGIIKGNYKEATAQEFTTAAATIDTEKLFTPDETTTKLGCELKTSTSASVKYSGGELGKAFEISGKTGAELKFVLEQVGEDGLNVAGAGNINFELLSNWQNLGNTKFNADFYADNTSLYLGASMTSTVTGTEQSSSFKYKIPYEKLAELIGGIIGQVTPSAEIGGEASADFSFSDIMAIAVQAGFKTYIDDTDGLKLKITADKETVTKLLNDIEPEISSMVTFGDGLKLEFYLAVDANGKFAGIATNYDISATVTIADKDTLTVSSKNTTSLKVYTGTIKFPANFDEYIEIPDFGDDINSAAY